jgi:hypothetical protein
MAVDNKGGSDLDVFEGLGKKSPGRSSQTPPPPPRSGNGPPPPPSLRGGDNGAKSTMLGMSSPALHPPPPPGAPASGPMRSAPPPPPGRGALPSVAAPPAKPSSSAQVNTPMFPPAISKSKPPPAPAAAAAPAAGGKLDMDWDDDEEATHVFDKDRDGSQADAAPLPPPQTSRGVQPPVSRPAPPPAKQTLLGVVAPPPPPPSMNPPHPGLPPPPQTLRPGGVPPPPSVGSAFARASSINSSSPGPAYPPPPPMDRPPQSLPLPPQQSTAPMAMPGRSSTAPGAPPPSAAASYRPPPPDIAPLPVPMPLPNRMEATALVRPPEPNRGLLYAGLIGGFLMVAAVVFYMWPHTGQIAVNVADAKGAPIPHLQIFIDGKKQCESAPCIVSDVATGSHTVKVEASGYDPTVDKAVAVESKKDMTVDFTLTPTAAAATGVKVQGTQQGAKLYVDDKEMGALPLELKDLQPGSHKVRIAAGDRYTAVEKTVTIANNEMQDLGSVSLKVIKGKVTVTLGTPGAKVFLVSGGDRREILQMPISLEIPDAATKTWTLVASKPGFTDYNQPVSFDDGQAEKAFTVTLEPKGAAAPAGPAVAWTPPPAPAPAYHPPAPTPAPPKEKETPAATEPSSGGGSGQAFLNINSIPASSVILDGKPIGQTPKLKFPVSPGSHSVLFVNADQGFKKQISVSVGAGETKPAIGKN